MVYKGIKNPDYGMTFFPEELKVITPQHQKENFNSCSYRSILVFFSNAIYKQVLLCSTSTSYSFKIKLYEMLLYVLPAETGKEMFFSIPYQQLSLKTDLCFV